MSSRTSEMEYGFQSSSDEEPVSLDSQLYTPETMNSPSLQDEEIKEYSELSTGDSPDRTIRQPIRLTSDIQNAPSADMSKTATSPKHSGQSSEPPVRKKRRFARLGENLDGSKKFRLIVKSCRKKVFLRRLHATKDLGDDFYIPNRAKLILDFLRQHGDRLVKERNGPKQSFPSTLTLVQHVMDASKKRSQD